MSLVVLTGAPGAGKTTLLHALQGRGYTIVGDTPRTIIQERRKRGLSPRPEREVFVRQTLRIDIENYDRHVADTNHVFFERGVLDALAGLDSIAPLGDGEFEAWLSKYPYFRKVFVLPPWQEIYVTDAERDHTFEHALMVDRVTREWYRRCGYEVVDVPIGPVEARCAFVLDAVTRLTHRA
jgi:predicted ATPase